MILSWKHILEILFHSISRLDIHHLVGKIDLYTSPLGSFTQVLI